MRKTSKRTTRGQSVVDRAMTQTQVANLAKSRQPSRSRITPGSSLKNVLENTITQNKSIDKKKVRQSFKSIASVNSKQSTTDESSVSQKAFPFYSFPNFALPSYRLTTFNQDPSASTRSTSASPERRSPAATRPRKAVKTPSRHP